MYSLLVQCFDVTLYKFDTSLSLSNGAEVKQLSCQTLTLPNAGTFLTDLVRRAIDVSV
jgi:hypothetical protein